MKTSFAFDSGNLGLDFLNTTKGTGGEVLELLVSPADLLAWLIDADLLTAREKALLGQSPPDARTLLAEALRLRYEIHAAVAAFSRGHEIPETSLLAMDRMLRTSRRSQRLTWDSGRLSLEDTLCPGPVHGVLAPVAAAGARLLIDGPPARLRRCSAADCAWWFLDTSKNGRRKWCSMARCGNRAKVAAHYRRQHRA
ncbi:MAG: CGNR zinc finger domain-containing protein [Planctomycetota bacterium]